MTCVWMQMSVGEGDECVWIGWLWGDLLIWRKRECEDIYIESYRES